jgi:carbon monoxide dehydrogenase subunit G
MKLTTTARVAAPREAVFAALVDPTVLQRAIPGCESMTASGPDTFEAQLKIGVAGLKGSYRGTVRLTDRRPPEFIGLEFDGKGAPGFVRGSALIQLLDEAGTTRVESQADIQVGGVIAAVGSRLIDAAARKLADDFFRQLTTELSASQ